MNLSRRRLFGLLPAAIAVPAIAEVVLAKAAPLVAKKAIDGSQHFDEIAKKIASASKTAEVAKTYEITRPNVLLTERVVLWEMMRLVEGKLKHKAVAPISALMTNAQQYGVNLDIGFDDLCLSIDDFSDQILAKAAQAMAGMINSYGPNVCFGRLETPTGLDWSLVVSNLDTGVSLRAVRGFDIRDYKYITRFDCLIGEPV